MEKHFLHIPESQSQLVVDFILQVNPRPRIITFTGDLGAGKTSLIKKLIASLGSADTATSPTFGLLNDYSLPNGKKVYHTDWYRIKHTSELLDAGMDELLDEADLMIVEWPEIGESLLPKDCMRIEIEHAQEDRNYIIRYSAKI